MKIWRPYTQEQGAPPSLLVQSAREAMLYLQNGQAVFDGISSWWLITHGHGQNEIQKAIAQQTESLAQIVFANFTHQPALELSAELEGLLPAELSRAFLSDNGSTAVEVAMKIALQHRAQTGQDRRRKFVAFARSYHGDTCGAMSVSQRGDFTRNYSDFLFEVLRCEQGQSVRDPVDVWVKDFLRILDEQGDQICAVLLEPLLQGAGGMIVWPTEAVRIICSEARRRGILVIFDEVMTGFGRTGTLFAFAQLGFTPDLLCLSKGLTGGFLPMGLTVASEELFSGFLSTAPGRMLFHGHSFTGNALSCAAAVANCKLWRLPGSHEALQRVVAAQAKALERARKSLPIRERRTCGTVAIMELDVPENYGGSFSRNLHRLCLERGVYLRTLGATVYLMPPYCASEKQIADAWDIIFDTVPLALSESN